MKQKSRFSNKIKEVSTAVFSASILALKGQKSLSFSGFSGEGGGKNLSSKNKPSEPYLRPPKTKNFSNKNRKFQNQKNTKKTRRHFLKFSLNTSLLLVLSKMFFNLFNSRPQNSAFNPNPTKPQDVFKLIKEVQGHSVSAAGEGRLSSSGDHVKTRGCRNLISSNIPRPPLPTPSNHQGSANNLGGNVYYMNWEIRYRYVSRGTTFCPTTGHTSYYTKSFRFRYSDTSRDEYPSYCYCTH